MKVMRMMWGVRLAVTLLGCLGVSGSAEPRFLCSSDSLSLWWDYEVFTAAQLGWRVIWMYKNYTWADLSEPLGPCEDYKICDVIKGETIRETIPLHVPFLVYTARGRCQVIFTLNIIDDFDQELRVKINFTLQGENDRALFQAVP